MIFLQIKESSMAAWGKCLFTVTVFLCIPSIDGSTRENSQNAEFRVEIVASQPNKVGQPLQLAIGRGFVGKDGRKIANETLEQYLAKPDEKDCVLHIYFHHTDKEKMTVNFLFNHIDTIRKLRDKKLKTFVYVIVN